jgi:hypothetical protein
MIRQAYFSITTDRISFIDRLDLETIFCNPDVTFLCLVANYLLHAEMGIKK